MKMTIREWRRTREISQQKAADAIGVHVNTYINWEKNPGVIPIKHIYTLAALFGASIEDFLIDETLQNVGTESA